MAFLPTDVTLPRAGASVGKARRRPRIRVRAGGRDLEVLRFWETGFALAASDTPGLGGRVDLYDGARHLCRALVVASSEEDGERAYEIKYANRATEGAPPADFAHDSARPVALLPPP
jgi:hypothetical protein